MKSLCLISSVLLATTLAFSTTGLAQEGSHVVSASPKSEASSQFSPSQIMQIEQITHDYIVNNPSVLIEASQKYREQAMKKEQEQVDKVKADIPKNKMEIFATVGLGRAVIGNPMGKTVIAEFLSYECPNCRAMGTVVENLIKSNPDLKVVIIPWPFEAPDDLYAAKAVLAAGKQGKMLQLHNALLASQEFLNKEKIDAIINTIGLDVNKLKIDMNDKNLEKAIKDNFALASKIGIVGTPSFFVTNAANGMTKFELIPGRASEDDLKKAIDSVK